MNELARVAFLAAPVVLAGIAHMVLVKLKVLEGLKIPLDGGREWRGKRIFGDNKTWRGVILMIALTMAFYWVQAELCARFELFRELAYYDYAAVNRAFAGFMLGLGYILAELPNSFTKRRLEIAPGGAEKGLRGRLFMVIDQGDSVLGCLLTMYAYWTPPLRVFIFTLVFGTVLHLLVNGLLNLARLKGNKDKPAPNED